MSRPRWQKAMCGQPTKRYYDTQLTACVALAKLLRYADHDGRPPPTRAYLCHCGLWHLTSKPFDPTRNPEGARP